MKIIVMLVMAVLVSASIAFAVSTTDGYKACENGFTLGGGTPPSGQGTAPTMSLKSSKGVKLNYLGSSDGTGYIIAGSHTSGTKSYGSSSGDTRIYIADGSEAGIPTTAPVGTASADWGATWSAQ